MAAAVSTDPGPETRLIVFHEVHRHHRPEEDRAEAVRAIRQRVAERFDLEVHTVVLVPAASLPRTSSGKSRRLECGCVIIPPARSRSSRNRPCTIAPHPRTCGTAALGCRSTAEGGCPTRQPWTPRAEPDRDPGLAVGADRRPPGPGRRTSGHGEPVRVLRVRLGDDGGISVELKRWLSRSLPPTLLYDAPTIEALAMHLSAGPEGEPASAPFPLLVHPMRNIPGRSPSSA